MLTILTVSCCAVITTPTLHQPIFTSLPRLIPIAGQSCAASAFLYARLDGGRISAWCGKFRSARCRRTGGLTVSFASTAAFWLAYCAIATIGAVLVVLRSGKAYAVLVAAAQTVAKNGEPRPLRLAPLHMDVHGDNIVLTSAGLRLIDWEYAGDGDIALELAAVWVEDERQHRQLANAYAACARIDARQLWRQIRLWHPWVIMLKAGWFEYRWRQTGEQQFIRLADETWRQLRMKG